MVVHPSAGAGKHIIHNFPATGERVNSADERISVKSSTETEATLMLVDDHTLLNHATTGSGCEMATFPAGPIRSRSARLVRNSANIQYAPIAVRL